MANIADTIHYVLPSGRCRPAIIVEFSAALAAQAQVNKATRRLSAAQDARTAAQAQVKDAAATVKAAQKNASAPAMAAQYTSSTSVAVLTETASQALAASQALVDALAAQQRAGDEVTAASGDVAAAGWNLDEAKATLSAAADVADVQVLTLGAADASDIPSPDRITFPLAVVRSDVAHDASAKPAPGTWHTSEECV